MFLNELKLKVDFCCRSLNDLLLLLHWKWNNGRVKSVWRNLSFAKLKLGLTLYRFIICNHHDDIDITNFSMNYTTAMNEQKNYLNYKVQTYNTTGET